MKTLLLLLGLALAVPVPEPPPCRVTATWKAARGFDDGLIGAPLRLISVTTGRGCSPARIVITNVGSWRGRSSAPVSLPPGTVTTFGPYALYRGVAWLSASGIPYPVPLPRGAP